MATIAINGLGRIGRAALEILVDTDGLDLVALDGGGAERAPIRMHMHRHGSS
jgi:glyceraldehyde-3-phosphate dehydrogenase/erythrose-4-phosphate dehydrogenase